MGQQQIILSIFASLVVGMAIIIGVTMMKDYYLFFNKEALITDITTISIESQQYRIKPSSYGGGGSYLSLTLDKLNFNLFPEDPNGFYTLKVINADEIIITGTGNVGQIPWIIEANVDGSGITTITDKQIAVW